MSSRLFIFRKLQPFIIAYPTKDGKGGLYRRPERMYLPPMHDYDEQPEAKSRSQLKRESTAIQKIGEALAALGDESIRKAPLPADVKAAVFDAKRCTKHEAKRRALQYVGKLMRSIDTAEIEDFLEHFRSGRSKSDRAFQQLELWREMLVGGDEDLMEELLERFSSLDRQRFRQLTLAARRERAKEQPPKNFRALFRYLREAVQEA